ncbi:GGDEF domain-containing protein [Chromatium okenii]|uniref:diguanylate cyclase n=1 Tax=Chromatium okenii TaxID=61644 RepID=A0A2S7XTZ7_9GAMM|nr:GGDEF domain-containing protein [Chromatium okenii]
MNMTSHADMPSLTLVSSVESPLRQPAESSVEPIAFLQAISASLELERVLNTLSRFLYDLVAHSGWEYHHPESGVARAGGKPDRHRLEYALTLNAQTMGTLTLMRGRRFSDHDQQRIESLLGLAGSALSNALQLHLTNQQLERDPLTGLGNRRALAAQGTQWLADSFRYQQPVSLLVMDLDRFKLVNDNFGHPFGDHLLRTIAEVLRSLTRTADLCVRLGGDEFVVLLPRTDLAEATECAERIRRRVNQLALTAPSGEAVQPSISIGVASCRAGMAIRQEQMLSEINDEAAQTHTDLNDARGNARQMRQIVATLLPHPPTAEALTAVAQTGIIPHYGIDLDLLYQRADTALYAAKHAGTNQVMQAH